MVSGQLFDTLERIARDVRGSVKPFGGIQLVLCGDFMQLPPVSRKEALSYCFEAKAWRSISITIEVARKHSLLELKHIFRQKEAEFIRILNELRIGSLSTGTVANSL